MKSATPMQRFINKIYKESEESCWLWIGCKDGQPRLPTDDPRGRYGRFALNGIRMMAAHRASYLLFIGDIPEGLQVCHRCDNTSCVNPNHLFLGTAQENTDVKLKKKRSAHQKIEGFSPRCGTGKYPRYKNQSGMWKNCFNCGKETFQRLESIRNNSKAACSLKCKTLMNPNCLPKRKD